MRLLSAADFQDRVTFITGPRRASGKTALALAALAILRREGISAGILGVGFEGESKGLSSAGARSARIGVETGDLFASASAWLGASGSEAEILGILRGSGAFGTLVLARARRPGMAVLVGPDSNEATAEAIDLMREEGAKAILVDGAFGRLTQVASIEGARFLQSVIIDRGTVEASLASMRRLAMLAALPAALPVAAALPLAAGSRGKALSAGEFVEIKGPLTAAGLAALPEEPSRIVIEDLTKVFLEDSALRSLRLRHELAVRRRIDFGGFVIALRGLSIGEFLGAIDAGEKGADPGLSAFDLPRTLLFASPYDEGAACDVA